MGASRSASDCVAPMARGTGSVRVVLVSAPSPRLLPGFRAMLAFAGGAAATSRAVPFRRRACQDAELEQLDEGKAAVPETRNTLPPAAASWKDPFVASAAGVPL